MKNREIERLIKRERYRICANPMCTIRFRLFGNMQQKYHKASCYKAHRRAILAEHNTIEDDGEEC